jgi:hypothetical protein
MVIISLGRTSKGDIVLWNEYIFGEYISRWLRKWENSCGKSEKKIKTECRNAWMDIVSQDEVVMSYGIAMSSDEDAS